MAGRAVRGPASLRTLFRSRQDMLGAALARLGVRRGIVMTLLLLTILLGPNGFLTNLPVVHAQVAPHAASQGKPNRFNPSQDAQSTLHLPPSGTSDPHWKPSMPQSLARSVPPPMKPGFLALTPGKAAQFLGSDGRLEVDVPATAITPGDQTWAGGTLTLRITQIAPASGATSGGSGLISFGTYLLQLVDVHGQRVPHGLRATLTVKYHYAPTEAALNLGHAFVVFNGTLPKGVQLAPAAAATTPALGAWGTHTTSLDTTHRTLSVAMPLATPSGSLSWDTNAPVATFGKPDLFNADLNAGALSASYPLNLPAGPGGLTPPLTLAYTSAGVSESHGVQSAAGWVGEGWNLAPGSISWAEHNALAGVAGGPLWESSWQLSDPYGTSAQLIPPNLNISTYYDDVGNPTTNLYESYQASIWSSTGFTWSNAVYLSGDFNGDGYGDVLAMYNLGGSSTGIYEWLGTGSGLSYKGQIWSVPSGFTWSNAKWVVGDFNGDGKTDLIAMYNLGGSSIGAYEWLGTSTGSFSYKGQIWSVASGFTWANAAFEAGDFNDDSYADVMAMYNLGGSSTGAYEWLGSSTGALSYKGSIWSVGSGFTWSNAKWVAGDFNGDGHADLLALYNLGTTVGIYQWLGTSTGVNYQGGIWTSGTFCWSCTSWTVGDVNGDGKADLLAMHDLGTQQNAPAVGIYEWLGASSGVTFQGQVWSSVGRGGFSFASAAFLAADYSGDGQADLLSMYDLGSGSTAAYAWLTTGTYLTNPVPWQTAPDAHAKIYSYWGPNNLVSLPDSYF
ncbi:MAG TPA: VCBS repeat-containing protein [Ktedonobacterales bacterium]|nr:VCBS repeat-containing protein [Ktedonobacterales bacterium]